MSSGRLIRINIFCNPNIWRCRLCKQYNILPMYVYCQMATSSGSSNYDRSKGGSQMTQCNERKSVQKGKLGGQISWTHPDFKSGQQSSSSNYIKHLIDITYVTSASEGLILQTPSDMLQLTFAIVQERGRVGISQYFYSFKYKIYYFDILHFPSSILFCNSSITVWSLYTLNRITKFEKIDK